MESEHSIPTFALGEGRGGPSKCKRMLTKRWGGGGGGWGLFQYERSPTNFCKVYSDLEKEKGNCD